MVKKSKSAEKSSLVHHVPYMTIVTIVAVVAIVILVLNFMKSSQVTTGEEAIVGEAGKIDISRAPLTASTVCKEGEKCGFVTQTQLSNLKLECKSFWGIGITHAACQAQGYDTCTGATIIARVSYDQSSSLFTYPMDCETEYSDDLVNSVIAENLEIDPVHIAGDKDAMTTCCRIK